ncbi:MAG TPA: nuclear transport factor 2 family protein [Terriglobia bacterium]|nr:nuclear transport factor 2 family protein [Terriglobia bacterium]
MMNPEIERACEKLVLDFAYHSDHQDPAALAALFIPEGTLIRPNGDTLRGRDAIRAAYEARPAGRLIRHLCTNIRVTVESESEARGLTYALVLSANASRAPQAHFGIEMDPRQLVGEFEDSFKRTPEGWRIASRHARFIMHTV